MRPNRVGSHLLADVSAPVETIATTTAGFNGAAPAYPAYNVITGDANVRDRFAFSFVKDTAQTWALASGDNFSIGKCITGNILDGQSSEGQLLNIVGSLTCSVTGFDTAVDCFVGRLTTGTPNAGYDTALNVVDNVYKVPCMSREGPFNSFLRQIDVAATVVEGLFDGSVAAVETNPIAVFWNFTNYGGDSETISHVCGSLSAFVWNKDVTIHQPYM